MAKTKDANKVTSTSVTDATTGVRVTTYGNGKIVTDTPNTTKGGFDRVVTKSPNADENKSSWVPPRLTLAGGAVEPLATLTIPKGTPIGSVATVIQQQIDQYLKSFPNAKPATVYGSLKMF